MTSRRNLSSESSTLAGDISRRQALTFGLGGLVAIGGLVAFGPRALGFTLVEADAAVAASFHNSCGGVQYHAQLASEVRSLLAGKDGAQVPEKISCPVCGCRVAMDTPPAAPADTIKR